jgi:hypothetical protein
VELFICLCWGANMNNTKDRIIRMAEKEINRDYPIFEEEKVLE